MRNGTEFVRECEGKRSLRKHQHEWEDHIILKWILNKVLGCGLDSSGSG